MPESFNSKRAIFPTGRQKAFLERVSKKSSKAFEEIASIVKVSKRTINDWRREKFLMPVSVVKQLSRFAHISIPQFKTRGRYDHVKNAGRLGGQAIVAKYGRVGGEPEKRKAAWKRWWDTKGRLIENDILKPKPFRKPSKSADLAEFIGIMMGDGGISKTQISITLHSIDDEKYKNYVIALLKRLFEVEPGIHKHKNALANTIFISRVNLVKFCIEILGLPLGNKVRQKLDIPTWINRKISFQRACVRGLIDTDGCLVIHKYRVNGKRYCYKKLSFCSASPALVKSVIQILRRFDFKPRLSHNGRNVWIDDQREVARYLETIGSSNSKHWERYKRQ